MATLKKQYSCALQLTHDLIGGKWKLRILWHILHGDDRYSLLNRAIPDMPQKVLTQQLRQLEDSGLITRTVYDETPPRVVYALAGQYAGLAPLIEESCAFTRAYARQNGITVPD